MKEKLSNKGIARRLFSVVLALAMVLTFMPVNSITAIAAEYSGRELKISTYTGNWQVRDPDSGNVITLEVGDVLAADIIFVKATYNVEGNVYRDGDKKTVNDYIDGVVTKVDTASQTIYLCTATDHEAKKAANDLCPNCDPDWKKVTGVSLDKTSLTLEKGATATLSATITPDSASNKAVTWSSNNTAVATVDKGLVTAVAAGTATITVKTTDGSYTADCTVTVTDSGSGNGDPTTPDTSGDIKVPTQKEEKNFGKGSLVSTPKELISAIDLTKDEKDAMEDNVNLNIWTEITKQEASGIKDADKQKITAKLPASYSVGTYLDIILKAQLDQQGSEERIITKTNKKIRLKLTVPTELQKTGRTYDIIRLHNGEATVLGATREGYDLTFETDGFSTYALIYTDAAPAAAPAPAPKAPKTGDTSNMPLVMFILAMSVVGLGFTSRKKISK